MVKRDYTAVDGSQVELITDLELDQAFSSVASASFGSMVHEFTVVPASAVDAIAGSHGIDLVDTHGYQGGVVKYGAASELSARGMVDRLNLLAWTGESYSMLTHIYGQASSADMLGVLSYYSVLESVDGLALLPRAGDDAKPLGDVHLLQGVAGFGLLDISPVTTRNAARLPRWRGTPLSNGDLYRETAGDGSPYYVYAQEGSITTVIVDPVLDSSRQLLSWLDTTRIHWALS